MHTKKNKKRKKKVVSGGDGYRYVGNDDGGGDEEEENNNPPAPPAPSNYELVSAACEELINNGDEWGAAAYAMECRQNGLISEDEYNELTRDNNPALKAILGLGNAIGLTK